MKTISASVGLRGRNLPADVRTVQDLLNRVPHSDGGPMIKLACDGIVGRKTNGAIEKLQATKWGWKRVDTRVDPGGPTWKLLLTYAPSDQPSAPAKLPPIKPPDPPKVLGSSFLIQMAAKPGQQLDANADNFYFKIMNYADQSQEALYFFGNVDVPPPNPTPWSITNPPIVTTPRPLGVADWAGDAILYEVNQGGTVRTEIWIEPDVMKGQTIRFQIHAHLDRPDNNPGRASSSFSSPFKLRAVSQGVKL
jgi:hypothetical protein